MSYIVSALPDELILNCNDTVKSVLQNVKCILLTRKGDIPLHREIGLTGNWVDKPITIAPTLMVADVKEAIEEGEPRAEFVQATFQVDESNPGKIIPIVEVNIRDE